MSSDTRLIHRGRLLDRWEKAPKASIDAMAIIKIPRSASGGFHDCTVGEKKGRRYYLSVGDFIEDRVVVNRESDQNRKVRSEQRRE